MSIALALGLAISLAAAPAPMPASATLLRMGFSSKPDPGIPNSGIAECPAGKSFFLESIAAAGPDRQERWRARVPTWLASQRVDCVNTIDIRNWHDPIERYYNYHNLYLGFVNLGDALAFSTRGGAFAVDAKTGACRFQWRPSKTSTGYYVFDRGTFEVLEKAGSLCKGEAPSATVFAACAGKLFYFDEKVAAVLDAKTGATLFETPWEDRFRDPGALGTRDAAHIPLGPYTLALAGMSSMR